MDESLLGHCTVFIPAPKNDINTAIKSSAPFLDPAFIALMNDIGRYGDEKYGEASFYQRSKRGIVDRGSHPRVQSAEIIKHSQEHGNMYLRGELHDHFGTREHQLAAVAFNAMMEYYFFKTECK